MRQIWSRHPQADNGGQEEVYARMPGQNGGMALCDSWVAQLEETDNPQSVWADKIPLSGRLNATLTCFCSLPLFPSVPACTCCSRYPSKYFSFSSLLSLYSLTICVSLTSVTLSAPSLWLFQMLPAADRQHQHAPGRLWLSARLSIFNVSSFCTRKHQSA